MTQQEEQELKIKLENLMQDFKITKDRSISLNIEVTPYESKFISQLLIWMRTK